MRRSLHLHGCSGSFCPAPTHSAPVSSGLRTFCPPTMPSNHRPSAKDGGRVSARRPQQEDEHLSPRRIRRLLQNERAFRRSVKHGSGLPTARVRGGMPNERSSLLLQRDLGGEAGRSERLWNLRRIEGIAARSKTPTAMGERGGHVTLSSVGKQHQTPFQGSTLPREDESCEDGALGQCNARGVASPRLPKKRKKKWAIIAIVVCLIQPSWLRTS